jgi:glyoxylase-like metal-dependent hydrolase (beta-lactamase superfamily II)
MATIFLSAAVFGLFFGSPSEHAFFHYSVGIKESIVRKFILVSIALALLPSAALAQRQIDWDKVQVKTQKLDGSVYLLQFLGPEGPGGNVGGNVGALISEEGIAIVDCGYGPAAPKLEAALKAISDKPIEYLLNTHWHGDHTGANGYFGKSAVIIAHENARKKMEKGGGLFPPSPAVALAAVTFSDRITLRMKGGDILGVHFEHGHTDTDTIYFFPGAKVVQTGDDFVNWSPPGFPAIEMDNDGSGGVDGQIAADEYILAHAPLDVKIIPGHGNLATREDVVKMLAVLKDTRAAVQAGINQGKSLGQLKQEKVLAKWDYLNDSHHIQSDVYLERLYKTLSAKKNPGPAAAEQTDPQRLRLASTQAP